MKLNVNGVEHEVSSPLLTSLLHVLREELGITSPKAGCHQGGCGACTVLVDGEPRRSCLLPVAAVNGAGVTTLEGIGTAGAARARPAGVRPPLRDAVRVLHAGHAARRARAHRARGRRRRGGDLRSRSPGHVCRCTGYVKIVNAVGAAVRGESFDLTMTTGTPTTTLVTEGSE